MELTIYQIDAFAKKLFEGNPAAVIPLTTWLPDDTMQAIAAENNLAETVFFVPLEKTSDEAPDFHIRWFTPNKEVNLCGHATLAAAFVLFEETGFPGDVVRFDSLSGPLAVLREGGDLTLDFPAQHSTPCDIPKALVDGLGVTPKACFMGEDMLVILDSAETLASIVPDHTSLSTLEGRGVIVTALSDDYDFVARIFAPKYGIPEDPVTGSAYTQMIPYWAAQLDKTRLQAKQISTRGGELSCELLGDRVKIGGTAVKYMQGIIHC